MERKPGSVPAISARRLLAEVASSGGSTTAALRYAGLDAAALEGTEARLPLAAQYQLWEAAVAQTGDRTLPLRIAQRYDVPTYDVLGFACATAPDLATAYGRLVRFLALWVSGERAELLPTRHGARLLYHHELPRSLGLHLAAESSLAKIVFAGRRASGIEFAPDAVAFAHPAPADRSAHEAFFGCPVRFDASGYELTFAATTLAMPLRRADAELSAFFEKAAQRLLGEADATSLAARVRAAVAQALPSGPPDEAAVSRLLGCGARTLRRRLAEDGLTFRGILDDVRRVLAEGYLRNPGMSVAETAFLVGFTDAANFHRAFRRWTGCTPGIGRASCRERV